MRTTRIISQPRPPFGIARGHSRMHDLQRRHAISKTNPRARPCRARPRRARPLLGISERVVAAASRAAKQLWPIAHLQQFGYPPTQAMPGMAYRRTRSGDRVVLSRSDRFAIRTFSIRSSRRTAHASSWRTPISNSAPSPVAAARCHYGIFGSRPQFRALHRRVLAGPHRIRGDHLSGLALESMAAKIESERRPP